MEHAICTISIILIHLLLCSFEQCDDITPKNSHSVSHGFANSGFWNIHAGKGVVYRFFLCSAGLRNLFLLFIISVTCLKRPASD